MTLQEVDAAFNRALQAYINMPADLSPQDQKLMEAALESQIENLAKQRQALMAADAATTAQTTDSPTPAQETPLDGAFARGVENQTNYPQGSQASVTTVDPHQATSAGRHEEGAAGVGPDNNAYTWGMEAHNEETGQAATWLMTAQPQGDRQVFDEAFNSMIQNRPFGQAQATSRVHRGDRPVKAKAGQDLPASRKESLTAESVLRRLENAANNPTGDDKLATEGAARATSAGQDPPATRKEHLTAESLLRRLENAANNPTGGEKPTGSRPALLYSRPGAEVTVQVTKIKIVDNCESGSAEWRLDAWIGGTKKEWNKDGVTDSWYDLNWNVDVALADDSATLDFRTGGVEEDTFSDDDLPSESWSHDSSDNWGVGTTSSDTDCGANPADPSTDHCRDLGPSDGCEYRLYYNVIAKKPFADMLVGSNTFAHSVENVPNGLDYTISVWNDGPGDATGSTLTVNLDSGLTLLLSHPCEGYE